MGKFFHATEIKCLLYAESTFVKWRNKGSRLNLILWDGPFLPFYISSMHDLTNALVTELKDVPVEQTQKCTF